MRLLKGLTLLALCAVPLNAWLWLSGPAETETSKVDTGIRQEGNISDVGAKILNVASGIREFVDNWDEDPTADGSAVLKKTTAEDSTRQGHVSKGNVKSLVETSDSKSGSKVSSGSGWQLGSGSTMDLETTEPMPVNSTRCLTKGSDWPFCSSGGTEGFSLPNFLNHTSQEEVAVVFREWAWLLRSGCHHGVEWFFCLLLMPQCHQPSNKALKAPLPCRSFCEVLLDSCWINLQSRDLPVACHTLPEGQHLGQPCVVVSNLKGKIVS